MTDTAGFSNVSGFVDDTRAFCSIPARHDLARRIDVGYLARLVAEHRLELDEAIETAADLAYRLPLAAYQTLTIPPRRPVSGRGYGRCAPPTPTTGCGAAHPTSDSEVNRKLGRPGPR